MSFQFFSGKRIEKIIIWTVAVIILIAAGIVIKDEITYRLFADENDCILGGNVAIIKIHGEVVSYKIDGNFPPESFEEYADSVDGVSSEDVVAYLEDIDKDDQIKGIVVEVDSPGGSPLAAEEIMVALKKSSKPVVALIREMGTSAAYLIATGADRIFASKVSDVGGIGVTMSYLDYSQKNEDEGLIYQQIAAGEFKNTGDPDKSLSDKEKELLLRDTKKLHQIFIESVAENRGMAVEAVTKLADGSTLLGQDAKDAGLIDEIGDLDAAKSWMSNQLGTEPVVCVYE